MPPKVRVRRVPRPRDDEGPEVKDPHVAQRVCNSDAVRVSETNKSSIQIEKVSLFLQVSFVWPAHQELLSMCIFFGSVIRSRDCGESIGLAPGAWGVDENRSRKNIERSRAEAAMFPMAQPLRQE